MVLSRKERKLEGFVLPMINFFMQGSLFYAYTINFWFSIEEIFKIHYKNM